MTEAEFETIEREAEAAVEACWFPGGWTGDVEKLESAWSARVWPSGYEGLAEYFTADSALEALSQAAWYARHNCR